MLRALRLIHAAKSSSPSPSPSNPSTVTVDLHPSRPLYRGLSTPLGPISLEPDPTFPAISSTTSPSGTGTTTLSLNDSAHTILDDFFVVSGEIPRVTGYEVGLRRGVRYVEKDGVGSGEGGEGEGEGEWVSDELIRDERLVACRVKDKGLILFTGCSHAGILNTTLHALSLLNPPSPSPSSSPPRIPLYGVIGGFHLVGPEEDHIPQTVADLAELEPKVLVPGHCSGWRVKFEIERRLPGVLVPGVVGMGVRF
ncbi:MAG: hypothetical protein Q9227_003793 [Pyrenula ochraceoflavens]